MLILSLKGGHDGTLAAIDDGRLLFSLEAEKDSFPRYDRLTPELLAAAARHLDRIPDVIAISGWVKGFHSVERPTGAGYYGSDAALIKTFEQNYMGKTVKVFSSTHERSHIIGAYGMSPFEQGQPVYCLVWEGSIGDFYEIDADVRVRHVGHVMADPGNKYSFLFTIADEKFPKIKGHFRYEDAGKLMALAAYSDRSAATPEEKALIELLLDCDGLLLKMSKDDFAWSKFLDIGVQSTEFKNLAGKYSDALFERFHAFARNNLTKGLPLIIAGGCGLNCDWNTNWEDTGLFSEVFVPPCANDSGSAIGTAIDAQHFYTGDAKISWNVYAGEAFIDDLDRSQEEFRAQPLDLQEMARLLELGCVMGWMQGRYEIGPRALGNRSILAAPFSPSITERLNAIKRREGYRPIAPICLEEDAPGLFGRSAPSPYMLHFTRVRDENLKAITHVDGSARVQTVNRAQNPEMYDLLTHFKDRTGYGVLCNTSLNFSGRGFINRTSDLAEYCKTYGLDGFVAGSMMYLAKSYPSPAPRQAAGVA
jgi:hydroxymethyl cephem carbamoyltransferase